MNVDRYHRQSLLAPIGIDGQRRLADSRVLLVGCGALGATVADQLARAGVGFIRLVDRDLVELTNLQRQTLYDESDLDQPKAEAAARRLARVNSTITLDAVVTEANEQTIARLITIDRDRVDLIIDGTDNVPTRELINSISVQQNIPWIYGGCVGTEGRFMVVQPHVTPCLRCLFPDPPIDADLPTCDTAGVLGPAASVVSSLQSTAAIQLLSGNASAVHRGLTTFDLWTGNWRTAFATTEPDPDCPICGEQPAKLEKQPADDLLPRVLCGRNAVQFRVIGSPVAQLSDWVGRWKDYGQTRHSGQVLRFKPAAETAIELSLFSDGRVIIHGCSDIERARVMYHRYFQSDCM